MCWRPGHNAISHDVYLDTNFSDVNQGINPLLTTDVNSFDPCGLDANSTYYWRVDANDGNDTYTGDVWSFTTWNVDIDSNLAGWWKFDEGTGSDVNDSAGSNDGVIQSSGLFSWKTGIIGPYTLNLYTGADYVEIPDDDSLSPSKEITIAFWLYNRGGEDAGIYKYGGGSTYDGYYVGVSDSTKKIFFKVFSTPFDDDNMSSINTVPVNEWHHIAVTFNEGQAAIYIDGELDNSTLFSISSIFNDDWPLYIGAYRNYSSYTLYSRMNGMVDDVRIYGRALIGAEINELYQMGSP